MLFNMMNHLAHIRFRPCYPTSVMNEQALFPASNRMCITIPGIPVWVVDVRNPTTVVTVSDVLGTLHAFFDASVDREEFLTFPAEIQRTSADAFNRRISQNPAARPYGMKRLDLIYPNVFFVGLTRAVDGSLRWDIQLAPSVA